MSTADFQHFSALSYTHHVLARVGSFYGGDIFFRDECVAMDAHEIGAEFFRKCFERFVDEVLAALVFDRDVLLIG